MAEHFRGKNLTIHFSNGGGEALFRMWIAAAEKLILEAGMERVQDYLRYCLEDCVDGARAFGLDPPPAALESSTSLLCLTRIVQFCARELAKDSPDAAVADCGCNWDKELRLRWLAKLLDIHDMVSDTLSDHGILLQPIRITLPHDDEILVKISRLHHCWAELNSRKRKIASATRDDELQMINRIIALNLQRTPPDPNQLCYFYSEQSSLLTNLGRHQEALEALHNALKYETDPELQSSLKYIIEEAQLSLRTHAPTALRR